MTLPTWLEVDDLDGCRDEITIELGGCGVGNSDGGNVGRVGMPVL